MQRRVEQELAQADAALFVLNGDQGVGGPGDVWIADALRGGAVPVVIAVNKVDRTSNARTVAALQAAADLDLDAEVFPVSARTGHGVAPLVDHLAALLPPGPFFFPAEEISDQPESVVLAELVREQVLARTRQEIPHAVEVQVEEIADRGDLITVRALLWVETESQKGILIGSGGQHDQGDRLGRAGRAGARAGCAGPPRPVGPRAAVVAGGRRAARPARDHVTRVRNVNCAR